jgi:hypothetical protein
VSDNYASSWMSLMGQAGQADVILANSRFTSRVFKTHFSSIPVLPRVVYPGINIDAYRTQYNPNTDDLDLGQVISCVSTRCLQRTLTRRRVGTGRHSYR